MIGSLEKTVLDCPNPLALASFYCAVLGMQINEVIGDLVVIGSTPDRRELAFRKAINWAPPSWPDLEGSQRMHLDVRVNDPDRAEVELRMLGAQRCPSAAETTFRVFIDPAGHPFCIVFS